MLGVAAFLAVTALLAHEFSQFTGAFAGTPALPDAPVARAEDVTSFKAFRVHHPLQAAEVAEARTLSVAEIVHVNRHADRPVASPQPAAGRDAPAARVTPDRKSVV